MPKGGTRRRPPAISWRKVGMTSSPHGLYVQGYTRATMASTNRRKRAMGSKAKKHSLNTDRSRQLDTMTLESIGRVDNHAPRTTFRGTVNTDVHSRNGA